MYLYWMQKAIPNVFEVYSCLFIRLEEINRAGDYATFFIYMHRLVVYSLKLTHDFDPTPVIVSPIGIRVGTPAYSDPLVSPGVVWNHAESSGVGRNQLESSGAGRSCL